MNRLEEKAVRLRDMGFNVGNLGNRPAANAQGLYINDAFFDEQFVDQIIAGTPMEIVVENRELFIRSLG